MGRMPSSKRWNPEKKLKGGQRTTQHEEQEEDVERERNEATVAVTCLCAGPSTGQWRQDYLREEGAL